MLGRSLPRREEDLTACGAVRYTEAMHKDDIILNGMLLLAAAILAAGVLGALGVI